MQQFTIHFLSLNHLLQTISNSMIHCRPLFRGAVFFFVFSLFSFSYADLKIALVDTGFCPEKARVVSKKHKVLPALDMTGTNKYDCKKINKNELDKSGRFHGQHVLNEFLNFLPQKIEVTIRPLIVYDHTGTQTESGWNNAILYIEKEKMDMVLTASGFIHRGKLVSELPAIWFIPSGRKERLINETTELFPQNLAPQPNILVIGDYFDQGQIVYDQALLYQEKIDYYFPSGNKKFQGTSRAVAQAMARALEKCFIAQDITQAHSLRLCLLKNEKILRDPILKKEFKTF